MDIICTSAMSRRKDLYLPAKLANESTPEELLELEQLLLSWTPILHYPLQHITDMAIVCVYRQMLKTFYRHIERMEGAGTDWRQEEQRVAGVKKIPPLRHVKDLLRRWIVAACTVTGIALSAGIIFYNKAGENGYLFTTSLCSKCCGRCCP